MGLGDDNIFIFIKDYKGKRNSKKVSFFWTFRYLLKKDSKNIKKYYRTLFSWEKWQPDAYLLFFLFIFYSFLIITYTFIYFLVFKFIFYFIKYILKYIFFFIDILFFIISKKFLHIYLKKFLGIFYIIFIKSLYLFYKFIFYNLPLFGHVSYWVTVYKSTKEICIYFCHRILDIIEYFIKYLPDSKLVKFSKNTYYKYFYNSKWKYPFKRISRFFFVTHYYFTAYFALYSKYMINYIKFMKNKIKNFIKKIYINILTFPILKNYLYFFPYKFIIKYKLYLNYYKLKCDWLYFLYNYQQLRKNFIIFLKFKFLYLLDLFLKKIYITLFYFKSYIKKIIKNILFWF